MLTGGSAGMKGMVELGDQVFQMPVRLGLPIYSGGLSEVVRAPRYSAAVGLLISEMEQRKRNEHSRLAASNIKGVMERMAMWFKGNF